MTHILDDIRSDAIKFLDLLADVAPESVAQLSPRILPNLLSLLETNTSAPDGKCTEVSARTALLSQGSRLGIMRSCYKYLSVYTGTQAEPADPLQFMACDACPGLSLNNTGSNMYFHPDSPSPFGTLGLFGEAAAGGSDTADPTTAVRANSRDALGRLFPFLQATWTEASTVFAAGQIVAGPSLELCTITALILQTLWRAAYAGPIPPEDRRLAGFLRQCMVHFPFGAGHARDARVEEPLLSLNVLVCELVALTRQGTPEDAELARFLQRAVEFVVQTVGQPGSARLPYRQFSELLPAVWRLARGAAQEDADQLLTAVLHYARACPPTSPSKTLCIRFVSRLIRDQWSRAPVPGALCLDGAQLAGLAVGWVLELPKLLWQLRDRNPDASMAAVKALRLVIQRTRLLDAAAVDALQAGLVALFCVSVPGKGTVHGPFRLYPPPLQRALLEAASSCPRPSDKLRHAVRTSL
ncbi:rRNA processing protein, partial [Coemansia spiralis]